MASPAPTRSVRVFPGEIENGVVTTRRLVPSTGQPSWSPFQRVTESIANRGRQLPSHTHEREEVLTYVTEGFASYQLEGGTVEPLPRGSARLLTAPGQVSHRVGPAKGGAIRWFNLVVALPAGSADSPRLQSMGPESPSVEEDTVQVRPILGPGAPMTSVSGLACQELQFTGEGTTFRQVGANRRAVVYALSGRGAVDRKEMEGGEAALIEGMQGVAVEGHGGFCVIVATAPV
jgi:redox-sensitive bicupin YhaK (pirin superfamily)